MIAGYANSEKEVQCFFFFFSCDQFDCVFPTRTARFGCALLEGGHQLSLKNAQFANDTRPIDEACHCSTCKNYTRAYLHHIVRKETIACHLVSIHNVNFQVSKCSVIVMLMVVYGCL